MIEYDPSTKSVTFSARTTLNSETIRKRIEKSVEILFRTERIKGKVVTQAVYYKYLDYEIEEERKRPTKIESIPMNPEQMNTYIKELVEFKNGLQEAYKCYKSIIVKSEFKQLEKFLIDNNCSSEILLFGIGEKEFGI